MTENYHVTRSRSCGGASGLRADGQAGERGTGVCREGPDVLLTLGPVKWVLTPSTLPNENARKKLTTTFAESEISRQYADRRRNTLTGAGQANQNVRPLEGGDVRHRDQAPPSWSRRRFSNLGRLTS